MQFQRLLLDRKFIIGTETYSVEKVPKDQLIY